MCGASESEMEEKEEETKGRRKARKLLGTQGCDSESIRTRGDVPLPLNLNPLWRKQLFCLSLPLLCLPTTLDSNSVKANQNSLTLAESSKLGFLLLITN